MGSIQRGGMVSRNDNGTLERVDGTNTYIGSATLESGKVVTKRFRGPWQNEDKIIDQWLKWQGKNVDEIQEEDMAQENTNCKTSKCPFSGDECTPRCPMYSPNNRACTIMLGGIGLYNIGCNLMNLDPNDSLELIAMAVGDLRKADSEPVTPTVETKALTVDDGVKAYLEDKTFLSFVNLHSKTVYSPYKKFCEANGFPAESESGFSQVVLKSYPELKSEKTHGGRTFVAA